MTETSKTKKKRVIARDGGPIPPSWSYSKIKAQIWRESGFKVASFSRPRGIEMVNLEKDDQRFQMECQVRHGAKPRKCLLNILDRLRNGEEPVKEA